MNIAEGHHDRRDFLVDGFLQPPSDRLCDPEMPLLEQLLLGEAVAFQTGQAEGAENGPGQDDAEAHEQEQASQTVSGSVLPRVCHRDSANRWRSAR